jgi:hypothetical protein
MNTDTQRTFRALVWVDDQPAQRVEVVAQSLDEAEKSLKQQFGHAATLSIWNEGDAEKPR